jgi:ribonuclease HI
LVSAKLALNCEWNTEEDSLGSDHLPITLKFKNVVLESPDIADKITKFRYKFANWELFKRCLLLYNVESIEDDNVDVFYDNFTKAILSSAHKSIPICKTQIIGKYSGNGWWSEECKDAVLFKKQCYKMWLKNKTEENFINMKKAKINCNKVIALAKKHYWNDFCIKEISESKDIYKVWNKVSTMKNGFKTQSYPVKLLGNDFPSNMEKANAFVDFFVSNSLSSSLSADMKNKRLLEEEQLRKEYQNSNDNNDNCINSQIQYVEFVEALNSFSTNSTAIGLDGISYQVLIHLPEKWKLLLHSLFQKCWNNGTIPSIWKSSVVIPILKQGKPKYLINSYRPISLTSHTGKIFEKMIHKRLMYYCEKNDILPVQQAGFRKGRCTTDHLTKLTSQIKKQFSRKKSILATFFDVTKAYDSVWHERLLYKLNKIGISGKMFSYINCLLKDRYLCTRVGTTYSNSKFVDMGIPQGSIISPLLFTILIHDLPNALLETTQVVQYADDIAIWINTTIRKNTKKRIINYVQNFYQTEINKLTNYMNLNGLELSSEKTCLMLFNNGTNPKHLPIFKIKGNVLAYKHSVKFLGVTFTTKLNWTFHIDNLLTQARKRLNFLKIVSSQPWGQDIKTLLHLSISLVRSKLIYGQEVYYSAPKYLLTKIASLDSKAIKIAMGVPIHTNSIKCYKEVNLLSICEQRKLAVSKYLLRSLCVKNSNTEEVLIDSQKDYPKIARNIPYLLPMKDYTNDIMMDSNIDVTDIHDSPVISHIPPWEHLEADFHIDYTSVHKNDNVNILTTEVKEHISLNYPHHLKIYTDGSVLASKDCGCSFVIPDLKVERTFYLGKGFSIFTSELYAILMALSFISLIQKSFYNILICVDSISVLKSIQNWNCKIRTEMIFDIKYLIHEIRTAGIGIDFCWVPSHCGIFGNEIADRLAKQGAMKNVNEIENNNLKMSYHEHISLIERNIYSKFIEKYIPILNYPRYISILIYKLRLNTWKTKFSREIKCICQNNINVKHLIYECPVLTNLYKENNIKLDVFSESLLILYDPVIFDVANVIAKSNVYKLL